MTNAINQNQGCLTGILRLFGVKPEPAHTPPSVETIETPVTATVESLPYRVRDDFLSPTELSFYRVLASVVSNRAVICPKVGLAEIFFVARPHENQTYRNRILQKHLDFLLCDPKSMRPVLGIELDDSSHARSDRQARDKFVDQAFEAAKLPLIRVPAQYSYNTNELSAQLTQYLGAMTPSPAVPAETAPPPVSKATTADAPLCPKCGVTMIVRTVARGEHQGKQFYGCPNYPRCREMLPLKAQARG
jgi:predicted RNA-binding Zn-ribbon protein involved in translation (DUF1610 family)